VLIRKLSNEVYQKSPSLFHISVDGTVVLPVSSLPKTVALLAEAEGVELVSVAVLERPHHPREGRSLHLREVAGYEIGELFRWLGEIIPWYPSCVSFGIVRDAIV